MAFQTLDSNGRIKWSGQIGPQGPAGTSGKVVQIVGNQTGAVATGTTVIPFDDTIPQNTEGAQFLSQAITPVSATNMLEITAEVFVTVTGSTWIIVSLFQDTTANALATVPAFVTTSGGGLSIPLRHTMTSGTTSATTFKVRIGPNAPATVTLNGQAGARLFGGVAVSSLTIMEYTP